LHYLCNAGLGVLYGLVILHSLHVSVHPTVVSTVKSNINLKAFRPEEYSEVNPQRIKEDISNNVTS